MSNAASTPEFDMGDPEPASDGPDELPVVAVSTQRDVAVSAAIFAARDLSRSEDREGAREILERQLVEDPANNRLRNELAWVDFWDPARRGLGLNAMRQMLAESPDDTETVVDYASMLRIEGDYFTGLQELRRALQREGLERDQVRHELHSLYRELGWKFHERVSLREGDASWRDRVKILRSRVYWATGGPLWFVAAYFRRVEETAERSWTAWRGNLAQLDRIEALRPDVRASTSHAVDGYLCRWAMIGARANVLIGMARGRPSIGLMALLLVAVWSLALAVAGLPVVASIVLAICVCVLAVAIMAAIEWVCRRLSRLRLGDLATGFTLWVIVAGLVASMYSVNAYHVAVRWQFVAFAVLLTVAMVGPIVYVALSLPGLLFGLRIKNLRREHVRVGIIDSLLDALLWNEEYAEASHSDDRVYIVSSVMSAADQIEKGLPEIFGATDEQTRTWIRRRSLGAATALRRLARDVIIARASDDERIVRYLRQEIVAIATSRFGELRWSPLPLMERKSRGRQVLDTVRSLALMTLPAVFFFGFSPILGLPENVLAWGKIVSAVWFILLAAIALDPAIKEKLDLAKDLASTVRESKPQ